MRSPSRLAVVGAFAAIYLIWGSTYLGIRIAIETMPPLVMAGVRYATAGALLYAWLRIRGAEPTLPAHWRSAFVIGGLLLLGGNGAVSWAEQRVATGLAALLISTVPLWIAVLEWVRLGRRPSSWRFAGISLGLLGLFELVGPARLAAGPRPDTTSVIVLLTGALLWSMGTLYAREAVLPQSAFLGIAMEMLGGGALLVIAGLAIGEGQRVHLAAVSARSLLALLYLTLVGSLVGFSCYVWLLRVSSPAKVSTYAFVNPVVACFLGWWWGGEAVTPRMLVAAVAIVCAVALITLSAQGPKAALQGEGTGIRGRAPRGG